MHKVNIEHCRVVSPHDRAWVRVGFLGGILVIVRRVVAAAVVAAAAAVSGGHGAGCIEVSVAPTRGHLRSCRHLLHPATVARE